jgi:hypothetical protein
MLKFFDVSAKLFGSVFSVEDKAKKPKSKPQKKKKLPFCLLLYACL